MDRIYKYNPDASYKPNGGRYLQLINAKDLYIQNITVAEHDDDHSDSFQVIVPIHILAPALSVSSSVVVCI